MRMELSDRSRYLALNFLDQYENHISAKLLWGSVAARHFSSLKPFSALHCISFFGIAEIAVGMIRTKRWDVNQKDNRGMTPLMWAACKGHEEVAKLLLDKHTKPDIPDTMGGRTALSFSAERRHEGVVRLYLAKLFVNPQSIGQGWRKTLRRLNLLLKFVVFPSVFHSTTVYSFT